MSKIQRTFSPVQSTIEVVFWDKEHGLQLDDDVVIVDPVKRDPINCHLL